MISFGKHIRQANDPLTKLPLETVYHKIKAPHQKFIDFINQLRVVATIDATKYRQLKVKLPYLVAGVFNPNFRKNNNFVHTNYFILDIDHVFEKNIDLNNLFNKITKDPRVTLAFRSPSNDGIKVFFKLTNKCFDAGKYTLFYKHFAYRFSKQYNLNQVLDKSTSDVSRACFVSYDPSVYFNKNAEEVSIENHIDFENEELVSEIKFDTKKNEDEIKNNQPESNMTTNLDIGVQDLPKTLLREIREKLNPKLKEKREKNIFVPEELNLKEQQIKETMES